MMATLTNRRRREIASLARKKNRERYGQMLVEGVRSVEAAVNAGAPVLEILVTHETAGDPRVDRLLRKTAASVHVVSTGSLSSIAEVQNSQGIIAVVPIEVGSVDDLLGRSRVLALDGIQDPGNAGTLLRSAAWFGVEGVVTASGTVDLYNPKVVRSAMGGIWDLAHGQTEKLADGLALFRKAGFAVFGADIRGIPVEEWAPSRRAVLVLGSEAHGLAEEVREQVDEFVLIPGAAARQGTESLNVAVAGSILLYEWARRRDVRRERT